MELREWLFLVGVAIILVVVVDALRRAHRARRDKEEIFQGMGAPDLAASPLDDDFNPELPAGGFRVVNRPGEEQFSEEGGLSSAADEPASYDDSQDGMHAEPEDSPDQAYRVVQREQTAGQATRSSARDQFKERFLSPLKAVTREPSESRSGSEAPPRAATVSPEGGKQEILVMNVLSRDEGGFEGEKLRRLVEACGLELGKMQIFHRHEHGYQQGPIQFSMANAVEPGIFLPGFENKRIPGVCFFMQLPGPDDAMMAFDYMLETAQCLARNLNGELRDESQSVLSAQTIEHSRNRVREFARRTLSARV